jgi:ABC-2 type transport system ATP-binding protein
LSEAQTVCNHVQIIRQGRLVLADSIAGLSQRMHSQSLIVGLQHCPPLETLQALPGVKHIDVMDETHVRLLHDDNPTEALLEQAVAQRWGLFELSPEKRSLEQVFIELTANENTANENTTSNNALKEAA